MKKFALFAMLICAGFLTFGCAEKKADKPKDKTTTTAPDAGGDKAPETTPPAEPAK